MSLLNFYDNCVIFNEFNGFNICLHSSVHPNILSHYYPLFKILFPQIFYYNF